MYPKISIVTPSFNQGMFITETINSVLNQNYPNLEYWVIDGGSSDDTVDILKNFGGQIQWISEKDNGQTDAINKGLRLATGDIIAFINSDDFYLPDTFHTVANIFMDSNCMWLSGGYEIIDENNKIIQSFIPVYKRFLQLFSSSKLLSVVNYINQPSTFWKRELMNEVGFFDQSLNYALDFDYWIRAFQKYPLKTTKKSLSAFRIHATSKSGSQYIDQFDEELFVLKKHKIGFPFNSLHFLHSEVIKLIYRLIK
ncbi:MAG: glycosyltransferase [Anaerolineaceae bacterium]|nr:glycosyltransferase [Anaerolineaceae bacterium]